MARLHSLSVVRPLHQVVADMAVTAWRPETSCRWTQETCEMERMARDRLALINSLLLPQIERADKNSAEWLAIADQMTELEEAISAFDRAIQNFDDDQDDGISEYESRAYYGSRL